MSISNEELSEFEKLIADATPGPWLFNGFSEMPAIVNWNPAGSSCEISDDEWFISSARTFAPRLVDEVKRLNEELSACKTFPGGCGYWKERCKIRETELSDIKDDLKSLKEENKQLRAELDKYHDIPRLQYVEDQLADYKAACEVMVEALKEIEDSRVRIFEVVRAQKALEHDSVKKVLNEIS